MVIIVVASAAMKLWIEIQAFVVANNALVVKIATQLDSIAFCKLFFIQLAVNCLCFSSSLSLSLSQFTTYFSTFFLASICALF